MVARPEAPGSGAGASEPDPVKSLFRAWRQIVTRGLRLPGALARAASRSRVADSLRLGIRYATNPADTLRAGSARDLDRLKDAGAGALVVGAGLAFAVSAATGAAPARSFLAMGWTAAWALARLLILRLALPAGRRQAADAWGPALLPYSVAVIFPLDLLALALSARLTHRGLTALGVGRKDALRAVAWAFGGQLAVELIAWTGRAGLLALVAF